VLALACLGFAFDRALQPVLPLIIIDRGGDAVMVGIVAAVYTLPSLLFRPVIGGLIDKRLHDRVLRLGALVSVVAPGGLLLPGTVVLLAVRFLQGTAWAAYSVSTSALMARLAPPTRRGEASGYFEAMPALAMLVGPSIGVSLYLAAGVRGAVLFVSALAVAGLAVALRVRAPGSSASKPSSTGSSRAHDSSRIRFIVEPSALPSTILITTFMAAQTLFTVFPPVYAILVGAPVAVLAVYYPLYGIVTVVGRLIAGRASDRMGRWQAIRVGCIVAILGLVLPLLGNDLGAFVAGAVVYGVGSSFVVPTMSALTIDRAPADRLGSAMATYSVGYGLANGASSLLWGTIIVAANFSAAFVGAIGLQIVTIVASIVFASGDSARLATVRADRASDGR
jgi:MFS family permease